MTYRKDILILANSYKFQARCIAGRAIRDGRPAEWVRPVSAVKSGELSERDVQFEDGKSPAMLDIVRVYFKSPREHLYQTENELIDGNIYWEKLSEADQDTVNACLDEVEGELWLNVDSSYNGQNDQIPESMAPGVDSSLKFIAVNDLSVHVIQKYDGKKQVRGRFTLNKIFYNLVITDPIVDREYLCHGIGEYIVGNRNLCISISEPLNGYAYKLIAGMVDA